jgi:hypothetical protein
MDIDLRLLLGITSGVIAFIAYLMYIVSIIRGKTKPSRVTWWVYAFMGITIAVSYDLSGASNTIWLPYVEFTGPFLIALLSIKYGEGGFDDWTDKICLIGVFLSIALWFILDSPLVALVTNLVIDSFAIVPTIKKSYQRPEGEDLPAWLGTGFADVLNLFAAERFSFAILIYPIYMLVSDLIIIFILFFRRRNKIGNWDFLVRHK